MKHSRAWFLMVPLAIGLIAGCATTTSTVQSRKQERYAAYQALSPDQQAAVDQGSLKAGMPMDAVYIAFGNPTQAVNGGNTNGETITWVYQGAYTQESRIWTGYRMRYAYTPLTYVRAQVIFREGRVTQWQNFPAPVN